MDAKFQPNDLTPIAALTVGQFRELIGTIIKIEPAKVIPATTFPDTFGKKECSQFTGYAVNTINKMICERTIPFYKRNARVLFRRSEIEDWLLSNRIQTLEEYSEMKEKQLMERRRR